MKMFHNIKQKQKRRQKKTKQKEKKFFEAIYFFISSLCLKERKRGKKETIANVNSYDLSHPREA